MAAPTFPFDWPFSLVQPLEPVAAPSRCHRRQQPSTPFNAMPHDPHAAASSSSTPAAHELERASPSVMIASARSTRALSPTSPISQPAASMSTNTIASEEHTAKSTITRALAMPARCNLIHTRAAGWGHCCSVRCAAPVQSIDRSNSQRATTVSESGCGWNAMQQ